MRIIAGEAKGRRILSPTGKQTRPTSDRVKEALFNILGEKVPDAKVLDLFAGTGNLGLESISRGAECCVFIDNNKESIKTIHENINLLKYQNFSQVYNNDAFSALDILWNRGFNFDIIFLDPPYHKDIIIACMDNIVKYDIANSGCVIVAEHDIKDVVPENISQFTIFKRSAYGSTILSFYKKLAALKDIIEV